MIIFFRILLLKLGCLINETSDIKNQRRPSVCYALMFCGTPLMLEKGEIEIVHVIVTYLYPIRNLPTSVYQNF